MTGRWRGLLDRLSGTGVPQGFPGHLGKDERVLAVAESPDGQLVATRLGLWVPDGVGVRRIGWHLIGKATWGDGTLTVIEAAEDGTAGGAVLLVERSPIRYAMARPGRLPETVHTRVTGSIRSRHYHELPGGGAWFVQRSVPGVDGVILQVRPDPGTDRDAVTTLAAAVAAKITTHRIH